MQTAAAYAFNGRRALITGSSRGIGAAIARQLVAHGARVVIHGVNDEAAGQAVAQECAGQSPVAYLDIDLAADDAADRLVEQAQRLLGGIDILVLNASHQARRDWLALNSQDLAPYFAVNYRASLRLAQLVAPGMQASKWGRILAIGSVQELKPHPEMVAYSSFKHAQAGLVSTLSRLLAPHGITVNNLAPGVIQTDRNAQALANADYARQLLARIPAGRFGQPDDCAGAALFLCSDAAAYITGQTLYVDGGYGAS